MKIFYGCFNKRTEHGRKTKPRCMNCLKDGHVTRYCKETVMCPYCSENHTAELCKLHGKMTTNCTACARHAKQENPSINLPQLFAEAPRHLLHSPLDPTCPARIAGKVAQAASALRQKSGKQAVTVQAPKQVTHATEHIIIDDATRPKERVNKNSTTPEDNTDMSPTC